MRISTKLTIAALVPSFMALAVGAALLGSYRSIRALEENERAVYRIGEDLGELNDLSRSYVQYHEERPRQQFLFLHAETTRRIEAAALRDRHRRQFLEGVAERTGNVKALFVKLVSNYERHGPAGRGALLGKAEERLADQLFLRSREAKAEASRLAALISHDIVAGQRRLFMLALAFTAAAAAPLTLGLLGLMRTIGASLERLRKGTEIVGEGDLEHRISLSSNDEIGAVAQAFDRMTGKLHATTVSRDALAAEVAERRKTEAALEVELAERGRAEERARHLASFPQLNPNPVLELSSSGRVGYFNRAARVTLENLGLDKDDVDRFLPADPDEILRDLRRGESSLYREITIGDRVFGETLHLVPQLEVVRIYAFDITALKRAEEEVRAAREGLELRVAERTEELAVLAGRLGEELRRRTESERELAESEGRFRSLLEDTLVGFFIVQDGRVAFLNREQERLFGSVPPSMALADFAQVHPESRETFLSLSEAAGPSPGASRGIDLRFLLHDPETGTETTRWLHCRTSPIVWGGRGAVLVNMLDVTRARELEEIALVQEKLAALGHVAAGIAHEIRNPLSGINIYLASLEKLLAEAEGLSRESGEAAARILEIVSGASAKIESVIRRVMNFTRPDPPNFSPTDLNHCIRETAQLAEVKLRDDDIRLKVELAEDLPRCLADARLVELVLLNLVTNAAQAMEGSAGPRELEISSRAEGDHVVVAIADSGPGVPRNLRQKIFDPFFTTKKGGTGIGLSLTHRIVTDHDGVITVGSSRMGGAEFRVRLPAAAGREPVKPPA